MKVPVRSQGGGSRLNEALTPMIDVVFLLLIYFVWTTGFPSNESLLPGPLSNGTEGAPSGIDALPLASDFDPVVVRLRNADVGLASERIAIEVNEAPMESEAATFTFLKSLAELKADVPVVLAPDPDVAVKHVVRLYDGARLAGLKSLQFAANDGSPAKR